MPTKGGVAFRDTNLQNSMGLEFYDLSHPWGLGQPCWPYFEDVKIERLHTMAKSGVLTQRITTVMHSGTHIDAPSHFLSGGATVDELDLDPLLGPCWVAHVATLQSPLIVAADLDGAVPREAKRLLIRTRNSETEPDASFDQDYVALTKDAADWIVENGIICVGVDALSIERPEPESHGVHRRLFGARVAVVEGLRLAGISPGMYELLCLPLALAGSEGAPARVVLSFPG